MRILFTTNPVYGHLYPMLPLMNAARLADHEVSRKDVLTRLVALAKASDLSA